MIPLSVEFCLTTSATETNSSAYGRNVISCTGPNRAEYVVVIYQKKDIPNENSIQLLSYCG